MQCRGTRQRRGVLALEAAIVYPVMILLLIGLLVGGVAVFRSQQVACMAEEAARWTRVRAGDYARQSGTASPTEQEIVDRAIAPLLGGMDRNALTVKVEWVDRASGTAQNWDAAPKEVRSVTAQGEYVTNCVRVTVTYEYFGSAFLPGPLRLRSIAAVPLAS